MPSAATQTDISDVLAETERAGLRIVLAIRNGVVGFAMLFIAVTQGFATGWFGLLVISIFLLVGLLYRWLVLRALDRQWMRYAFASLDMGLLALVAILVPLSIHGEVPQIFVFRVYGVPAFFFLLATSALSLSPRLVMWTGASAVLALWTAWGWIVMQMDRWVTWSAIADDRTGQKYIEIVLDPDHIQFANRITETMLILATSAVTATAVARARRLLSEQISAERARSHMTEVFGRFVPAEVTSDLAERDGSIPAVSREATVMFVDIEGFTSFAETAEPARLIAVLDAFFETVSEAASAHKGVCISLIGDAAMVAFNAPLTNSDHAGAALATAEDLLKTVETREFAGEKLAIRIGLATGPVAAGTVGGRGRRAYTLYGDTVNLAQRLEAMNKETSTRLLLDDPTWERAGRPAHLAAMREVHVKGRAAPVLTHGLAAS
ncbi:MAG: adenylate/guanylate cyclase domain-containing protein [Pseudomonadota bacterium]